MTDIALADLLAPYILSGQDLGVYHVLLTVLYVDELQCAWDDDATVLWGTARLNGQIDPPSITPTPNGFTITDGGSISDGHPASHTTPAGSVWDWHDVNIAFRLTVPRLSSAIVDGAETMGLSSTTLTTLLNTLGPRTGTASSDYPDTQFRLDVLLTLVTVHLPVLTGAQLQPNGVLKRDPAHKDVSITLPKILLAFTQGSTAGSGINATLESWGAEGLDDPADTGEADLIEMHPPYAMIGDSDTLGFGFRRAILDLSDDHTPPEVLSQFGAGDDWHGIYLPEARLFFQVPGVDGLDVDVSVKDLLYGLNPTSGISCDIEVDVVNLTKPLTVGIRFYDSQGKQYDPVPDADKHMIVLVPPKTVMVVDVNSGQPPYSVKVDGAEITGAAHQQKSVDLSGGPKDLHVVVTDSLATPNRYEVTIHAVPVATPAPAGGGGGGGGGGGAPVAGRPVMTPASPRVEQNNHSLEMTNAASGPEDRAIMRVVPDTNVSVAVILTPAGGAAQPPQSPAITNGTFVVPMNPGDNADITVTWTETVSTLVAFFRFDHPRPEDPVSFSLAPDNTSTTPATSQAKDASWESQAQFKVFKHDTAEVSTNPDDEPSSSDDQSPLVGSPELQRWLQHLDPSIAVTIDGYASYEPERGTQDDPYNRPLSHRRAAGLRDLLLSNAAAQMPAAVTLNDHSNDRAFADFTGPHAGDYNPALYWRAQATYTLPPGTGTTTVKAHLQRPAPAPPPPPPPPPPPEDQVKDPPTGAAPKVPFFHSISVITRFAQGKLIAAELKGEVDIKAWAKDRLEAEHDSHAPGGDADFDDALANPTDGFTDYDVIVSYDDAIGEWRVALSLRAAASDTDGLWSFPRLVPGKDPPPNYWRDVLGLFTVLTPLLNPISSAAANVTETAGGSAATGDIVSVAVAAGIPFAIAALDVAHTDQYTLYGGELVVRVLEHGSDAVLLFDVQTKMNVDLGIVQARPTVRYKAVGLRLNAGFDHASRTLAPVFDASKGYEIDIADPSTTTVKGPLGEILHVLGARIARTNPLNLEVDLGIKADLGVISVDRAKVRLPLDPAGPPTLTALGLGVDIAGALEGHGYAEILPAGFKGSLDLHLTALGLRIAAGVIFEHIDPDDTGVLLQLDCEFPVPIPLYTTGLGIYGFAGLFAMHEKRTEDETVPQPALDWLINKAKGDPSLPAPEAWTADVGHWAFGVGTVLGTFDTGIVLNLKGMVILELPGPRLLIIMNANILSIAGRPDTKGTETGTILAVIDLDFGREQITIELAVHYGLEPILNVQIPADAFFSFADPANWKLDVGEYHNQASVSVFDIFKATGYVEIHGRGITDVDPLGTLSGFAVALGVHVSFVWGDTDVGLYLKVSAGLDVGVGFAPIHMKGKMSLSGELHLFIVGIEAHGDLDADIDEHHYQIHGDVCGEVDFFFFSVSGCVDFTLGGPAPTPGIPKLARSMSLHSRSPALVSGSGTDRPVDASYGDAQTDDSPPGYQMPVVPIDSIPVLQLEFPSKIADPWSGPFASPGTPSNLGTDGWSKRGSKYFRYTISSIDISPSVSAGAAPSVWWTRTAQPDGDANTAQIALLDWIPNPTPKAVVRSKVLDQLVDERWGHVCDPIAPPARVLWTFQHSALGPSSAGWMLNGAAWPDPPGTQRSAPPVTGLRVVETWRTGDAVLDALLETDPAAVIGMDVICPRPAVPSPPRLGPLPVHIAALLGDSAPKLLRAAQPASELTDALLRLAPDTAIATPSGEVMASRGKLCPSRVLRGPFTTPFTKQQSTLSGIIPDLEALIAEGTKAYGATGDLADVIQLDAALTHIRLLALVPTRLRYGGFLRLRALADDGSTLADIPVSGHEVTALSDLPATWLDGSGPWATDVYLGLEFLAYVRAAHLSGPSLYSIILIDEALPDRTAAVRFGIHNLPAIAHELRPTPPSYLIAAIEGLTLAEGGRADWDETKRQDDIKTIEGALSADPATTPLLPPGQKYQVTVKWTGEEGADDGHGTVSKTGVSDSGTQHFTFQTDTAAPTRLDPWVLCTNPSPDEALHFYGDPIRIVFATDDVIQLYAAYKRTLTAKVRAASFRPPPTTPPSATSAKLDASAVHPIAGHVLSPFEEAVRDTLAGSPCVNSSGESLRHSITTLNFDLDPVTPYVLDIETDLPPGDPVLPLFRRSFATSRYHDMGALAQDVLQAPKTSRHIMADAPLLALPDEATEAQMDAALHDAGLGGKPRPAAPEVTILWIDGAPPRPAAVLIDTPEPLWRYRPEPQKLPADPADPLQQTHWELVPTLWLQPAEATPAVASSRLVRTQAGARTLALLRPGARGLTLTMVLQRGFNDLLDAAPAGAPIALCTVPLLMAPWEYRP